MNILFEGLDDNEQKAVKFAFTEVSKLDYRGTKSRLLKLNANGTSGYPVYYLYFSSNGQAYDLRIIKQGRKCKLAPFGNPKIIWAFVGDSSVKAPNRQNSSIEAFSTVFKPIPATAQEVIKWLNTNLDATLSMEDFGLSSTNVPVTKTVSKSNKITPADLDKAKKANTEKTTNTKSTITSTDVLKAKRLKCMKKEVDSIVKEHKASKSLLKKSIIEIDLDQLSTNIESKTMDALWPAKTKQAYGNDVESFMKDVYANRLTYFPEIPGYTRSFDVESWGDYYNSYSVIEKVTYTAKPCKEFESLNKYITGILKCDALKVGDVRRENISGKRSSIFERHVVADLAFDPEVCKEVKAKLQKIKKPNWSATMTKKNYRNDSDRYDYEGYDMESEWDGCDIYYMYVVFKSPKGKIMEEVDIRPLGVRYHEDDNRFQRIPGYY